ASSCGEEHPTADESGVISRGLWVSTMTPRSSAKTWVAMTPGSSARPLVSTLSPARTAGARVDYDATVINDRCLDSEAVVNGASARQHGPEGREVGAAQDRSPKNQIRQTYAEMADDDPPNRRPRRAGDDRFADRRRRIRIAIEQAGVAIPHEFLEVVDKE